MALFILKPVLWNTNGYLRPSGVKASKSSFPGTNGYGHEEWNNSPHLEFKEKGLAFRAFHTESVGKAPVAENAGQTFVFMTARHDGIQQLVGIAGNAKFLEEKNERIHLAKKLDIGSFADDAWALPSVKALGRAHFKNIWGKDLHWIPNWICPAEFFLWFDKPVTLDPIQLIGKTVLPTMFASYMSIEREVAAKVMNMVPEAQRLEVWVNLMDAMQSAPEEFFAPQEGDTKTNSTTRLAEYQARVGQGIYRQRVMQKWERTCSVTGLGCAALVKASHVKPWKASTSSERLDGDNGLLLAAHLDALFDRGLISFDGEGAMLLSDRLPLEEQAYFRLPQSLRKPPNARLRQFLKYHREHIFGKQPVTSTGRLKHK